MISIQDWKTKFHSSQVNNTKTWVWPVSWGHSYCWILNTVLGRLLVRPAALGHAIPGHSLGVSLVRHHLKSSPACGFAAVWELSSMGMAKQYGHEQQPQRHLALWPENGLWPLLLTRPDGARSGSGVGKALPSFCCSQDLTLPLETMTAVTYRHALSSCMKGKHPGAPAVWWGPARTCLGPAETGPRATWAFGERKGKLFP